MSKQSFIKKVIDRLNDYNEFNIDEDGPPLDVCFIIAAIDQSIDKHKEFMEDIDSKDYSIGINECDNEYIYAKIKVYFDQYHYEITASYDERYWRYCDCTKDMPGYNNEHHCCGDGCDWDAPKYSIQKIIDIGMGTWVGNESDYWKYQDAFNEDEDNKRKAVEDQQTKQLIERLESQLQDIQDELRKLRSKGNHG